MDDLARLKSVRPGKSPWTLDVVWKDGARNTIDLTGLIYRSRHFRRFLGEPLAFRKVKVVDWGAGVGWDNGLDYSADTLRTVADEQQPLSGKDLVAFETANNLNSAETAALFDVSERTIRDYRASERLPQAVALALRAMRSSTTVLDAHYRPTTRRPRGRPRKTALGYQPPSRMVSASGGSIGGLGMRTTCRLLGVPLALLLGVFMGGAGTLTTMYFPPSDAGSPLDVLMRGQFAAILAETNEPILHEPRGNTYAVRVTAYTVRGAVSFLRIERKADGVVLSTFRRYGFSDLGVPLQRSIVQKNLPGAALTQLSSEIQRQNFFSLGSTGTVATVDVPVCLIEVYDGRAYHSAFRSGCPRDTPFGAIASRAAEIAGVDYLAD